MAELLVNIDVDDLEKAVAFYRAAVGLTVGRRFGAFAVELLGASSAIYLLVKAPGTQASPATDQRRDYARHWTPVHLDIVVAEVEAAVAQATRVRSRPRRRDRPTTGDALRIWPIPSATGSV